MYAFIYSPLTAGRGRRRIPASSRSSARRLLRRRQAIGGPSAASRTLQQHCFPSPTADGAARAGRGGMARSDTSQGRCDASFCSSHSFVCLPYPPPHLRASPIAHARAAPLSLSPLPRPNCLPLRCPHPLRPPSMAYAHKALLLSSPKPLPTAHAPCPQCSYLRNPPLRPRPQLAMQRVRSRASPVLYAGPCDLLGPRCRDWRSEVQLRRDRLEGGGKRRWQWRREGREERYCNDRQWKEYRE